MKPNLVDITCELLKWLCNYRKLHDATTREQFWQYSSCSWPNHTRTPELNQTDSRVWCSLQREPWESPSSPRLDTPTKNTLPSSATSRPCCPSWPTLHWMIRGHLTIASSFQSTAVVTATAAAAGDGGVDLMPKHWDLPVYSTYNQTGLDWTLH